MPDANKQLLGRKAVGGKREPSASNNRELLEPASQRVSPRASQRQLDFSSKAYPDPQALTQRLSSPALPGLRLTSSRPAAGGILPSFPSWPCTACVWALLPT